MVSVCYDDAEAFAEWAGKHIPTEQEWEYAARGPEGFFYPWGDQWFDDASHANWGGQGGDRSLEPILLPVESLPEGRSWCGAYHLLGNVAELTSSWFSAYPGNELTHPFMGEYVKVIRGATLRDQDPLALRSAARNFKGAGMKGPPRPREPVPVRRLPLRRLRGDRAGPARPDRAPRLPGPAGDRARPPRRTATSARPPWVGRLPGRGEGPRLRPGPRPRDRARPPEPRCSSSTCKDTKIKSRSVLMSRPAWRATRSRSPSSTPTWRWRRCSSARPASPARRGRRRTRTGRARSPRLPRSSRAPVRPGPTSSPSGTAAGASPRRPRSSCASSTRPRPRPAGST